VKRLKFSRKLGYAGAALLLSATLHAAEQGAAARPAESVEEYARQLAERALAHEHGEGVARDPGQAAALYCEAARLGDGGAMYALGWMYANGRGIDRSDAFASALFTMAAERGDEQARNMLRFTGVELAQKPPCLDTPPPSLADSEWNLEHRMRGLSKDRREIAQMVVELAGHYQISPGFALAIAVTESALNPGAVSPKNAMGVMQLIPDTAARFNVSNAFDPRENIKGGLAYLRWLLAYFEGDLVLAAAAYNAGEGAVDRYRGIPPYKETQAYVERVMRQVQRRHHPFDSKLVEPSPVFVAMRLAAQQKADE